MHINRRSLLSYLGGGSHYLYTRIMNFDKKYLSALMVYSSHKEVTELIDSKKRIVSSSFYYPLTSFKAPTGIRLFFAPILVLCSLFFSIFAMQTQDYWVVLVTIPLTILFVYAFAWAIADAKLLREIVKSGFLNKKFPKKFEWPTRKIIEE